MQGHDIIVVGASAGGVEALMELARGLSADLPAAVFVVLHLPPHTSSALPHILTRVGQLPALHPQNGEPIHPGKIYVAPSDHHMLIRDGHIELTRGPRENGHRPAIDPLFRSAGRTYAERVIGVVLTGALDDGAAGLAAIKARGGIAVVQNPETALYPSMPRSAIENVATDHITDLADLPALLNKLAAEPIPAAAPPVSDTMEIEVEMAEMNMAAYQNGERPGTPAGFGCPDCGGALFEIREGELLRFRCRVGHAWSSESLLAEQADALEDALWVALRALEERAALSERMAAAARERGHIHIVRRFEEQVGELRRRAELIRNFLVKNDE